ncbi:MAG: DUF5606 domain-containing protein [Paludibacter sp.]|jgi:hypothetical protein|nr:DUF5606 domain-containing protein [Paludibacter sp.]
MLKEILSITGKSGLYKLVSRGKNMLVVESLLDGKRIPAYSHDKVIALGDISIFTQNGDIKLGDVLEKVKTKENSAATTIDAKADNDVLRTYLAEVQPDFDRERVYPSDIRKMLNWYNILINAGITDFQTEEENKEGEPTTELAEKEPVKKAQVQKNTTVRVQDKKMQTTKSTRTKV